MTDCEKKCDPKGERYIDNKCISFKNYPKLKKKLGLRNKEYICTYMY